VPGRSGAVAEADGLVEQIAGSVRTWGECLRAEDEAGLAARMRHGENTGRPLSAGTVVRTVGRLLGPRSSARRSWQNRSSWTPPTFWTLAG